MLSDFRQEGGYSSGVMKINYGEFPIGHYRNQAGDNPADFVEKVQIHLDSRLPRQAEDMEHGVGGSPDRHIHGYGVAESGGT